MNKLNNIKKIRWDKNITVRKLAKLSGMSHSQITELENGKSTPTQITMMRVAKALDKKTDEVFMLDWKKLDL